MSISNVLGWAILGGVLAGGLVVCINSLGFYVVAKGLLISVGVTAALTLGMYLILKGK